MPDIFDPLVYIAAHMMQSKSIGAESLIRHARGPPNTVLGNQIALWATCSPCHLFGHCHLRIGMHSPLSNPMNMGCPSMLEPRIPTLPRWEVDTHYRRPNAHLSQSMYAVASFQLTQTTG